MTGGQDSAGTGRIESICAGIGVDPAHIRVMVPLKKNYDEMKAIIREAGSYTHRDVYKRQCPYYPGTGFSRNPSYRNLS